jgi:flavin-binding protein dodecin
LEKEMAVGSTYKVVELVGSSSESIQQAIDGAITRAAATIRNLDWFEVREIRGTIDGEKANWYQVKVGIGFRVDSGDDVSQD